MTLLFAGIQAAPRTLIQGALRPEPTHNGYIFHPLDGCTSAEIAAVRKHGPKRVHARAFTPAGPWGALRPGFRRAAASPGGLGRGAETRDAQRGDRDAGGGLRA